MMRYCLLLLLTAVAYAQPIPGKTTVTPQLGIPSAVEQGAKLEVAPSGAPITRTSGYAPSTLIKAANGGPGQVAVCSTNYSTDLGDCFNLYQVGANGSVHFDAGWGQVGPFGIDIVLAPADGSITVEGAALFVSLTGSAGATLEQTHSFSGTGVGTKQSLVIKSFVDPDGGGATSSQLEEFYTSVNDGTSHQTGAGTNYKSVGRDGAVHGGYRAGINAIYSDANTFTSNGYTLYDYDNGENIFVASTTRPHTLVFPETIFPVVTATTVTGLGTCSTIGEGAIKPVTDSNTNTWGATIGGGGSLHVLAYCDGTNWTVMAK